MSKREERAAEIQLIRHRIGQSLAEIDQLVDEQPDEMNLGTWRAGGPADGAALPRAGPAGARDRPAAERGVTRLLAPAGHA